MFPAEPTCAGRVTLVNEVIDLEDVRGAGERLSDRAGPVPTYSQVALYVHRLGAPPERGFVQVTPMWRTVSPISASDSSPNAPA